MPQLRDDTHENRGHFPGSDGTRRSRSCEREYSADTGRRQPDCKSDSAAHLLVTSLSPKRKRTIANLAPLRSFGALDDPGVQFHEVTAQRVELLVKPLRCTRPSCTHWPHVPRNFRSRTCQLRLDRSVWQSQDSGCLQD